MARVNLTLVICWQTSKLKEGKMKIRKVYSFLVVSLLLTILSFAYVNKSTPLSAADNILKLEPPRFVNVARADSSAIASRLDDEAGIAAYYQASVPVDLDDVRDLYHTIKIETPDYILGSMPVPDNWEDYDPHVYIHTSGWMLAYYLRDEPAVKLFDWQTYAGTMTPTRFQAVLNHVAAILSLPDPTLTYYDFRYPNATNLLLAVEDVQTTSTWLAESFDILDTSFIYYERSWGLGGTFGYCNNCNGWANYQLDGAEIHRINAETATRFDTGFLSVAQLLPDDPHTIDVTNGTGNGFIMGALAIVYGP